MPTEITLKNNTQQTQTDTNKTNKQENPMSDGLRSLLLDLHLLLALTWLLDDPALFTRHAGLGHEDVDRLGDARSDLLARVRRQAVSVVDAFDLR